METKIQISIAQVHLYIRPMFRINVFQLNTMGKCGLCIYFISQHEC